MEQCYDIFSENINIDFILIDIEENINEYKKFYTNLKQDSTTEHIKIIAIGTDDSANKHKEIISEGFEAYVIKPFDENSFYTAIDKAFT